MHSFGISAKHKVNGPSADWHRWTTQQQQPFNGRLSGTTRAGRYQKKHSPAHTHPGQRTSFITFVHLQDSTASSLFSLRAWQSSRTTSFQVLFGLPLGLQPSTSYSMHFFPQSSSSFRSTCSGVLLKMEVGIRKRAWQRDWRYPAYLWSMRWVYAVKRTREVGIHRIPAYTPQYTTEHMPIPTQPVLLQYQCYVIYT